MFIITLVLLALLFIVGLINTFYNFPTKKFMAWLQSFFFAKSTPSHVTTNPSSTVAHMKVKSSTRHNKLELKSVFATFDKNNDGYITRQELRESLKNIGILMADKDVADMVEKVDSNGDGLIDLDEFCELFESMVSTTGEEVSGEDGKEEEGGGGGGKEEDGETDLKEAFDVFDGDRDGLISVEELGLVLSSLGFEQGKKMEDCKEMIRKVDMDGDGMVNFDEFKRMMKAGNGRFLVVT